MSHLNDPAVVRAQYASERGLQARAALWSELDGPNPKDALWETVVACAPRVASELGSEVTMIVQSKRMVEIARVLEPGGHPIASTNSKFTRGSCST